MQWGIDEAKRRRLPVIVIAADGTERFYLKWFTREAGKVTEGEGNPLAGVKGGAILVRDNHNEA